MEPRGWQEAGHAAAFAANLHSSTVPTWGEGSEKNAIRAKARHKSCRQSGNAVMLPQFMQRK
jgi:hypothetical protein